MITQKKYDKLKALLIAQRNKSRLTESSHYDFVIDAIVRKHYDKNILDMDKYIKTWKPNAERAMDNFFKTYPHLFSPKDAFKLFTLDEGEQKDLLLTNGDYAFVETTLEDAYVAYMG